MTMTGKMIDPILINGGSPQDILATLVKLADLPLTKEQEYTCLKILYVLSKYATVPDFLAMCTPAKVSSLGITGKQLESLQLFLGILRQSSH
jgi:hypothetical protein